MNLQSFHRTKLARIIGFVIIGCLVLLYLLKLSGADNGQLQWSNIFSTTFFGLLYLFFVFFPWERK